MATTDNPPQGALAGRVAIVTGGAAGIGRATAQALAAEGARLIIADIDEAGASETAALLTTAGHAAVSLRTDVTQDGDCARLVNTALEEYKQLDIAFNNAGIAGAPSLTADYGPDNWQRVIDVNLTGVFNCLTHELKAMQKNGGSIVNTASIMGLIGTVGGSAYCASKHGVIGLTKAAALEYGHLGIRVNAICPGHVSTGLTVGEKSLFTPERLEKDIGKTALKRIASSEEIAEFVVWLCSDKAAYATGASYTIDGGFSTGR